MVEWISIKETEGKIPFENIERITVEPYELSSHIETNAAPTVVQKWTEVGRSEKDS